MDEAGDVYGHGDGDGECSNRRREPEVAVIATKPLTDDSSWTEFRKGDLMLFVNGKIASSANFYNGNVRVDNRQ